MLLGDEIRDSTRNIVEARQRQPQIPLITPAIRDSIEGVIRRTIHQEYLRTFIPMFHEFDYLDYLNRQYIKLSGGSAQEASCETLDSS